MLHPMILAGTLVAGLMLAVTSAKADSMSDAKRFVDRYTAHVTTWDGPTTGPKAARGKIIVVLAGDMKNDGILGVTNGIAEAAKAIGWTVRTLDGAGAVAGRTAAFDQALALKPDGIVICGFDAREQKPGMDAAKAAHVPLVSWHGATSIGPVPDAGIFANVTTDPIAVSTAAADWAFLDAKGKPGVVIFTDSTFAIATAKAKAMKTTIEALGGSVLEWVDLPIARIADRMPRLTTSLLHKYGAAWTHSLAINDLYYDFMGPSLAAAGIEGTGAPVNVAAGDGSGNAYRRIRLGQYQAITVAEPLNLQGWQLVDELNRAFAGEKWSGYVSPLHVVTKANVEFDGGPKNAFDPGDGYRAAYRKIWGVSQE